MTTPPVLPSRPRAPRRGFRFGHWFLVVTAALVIVAVVEAAGAFRLSREAGEVRTAIERVVRGDTATEVQFSVGPGALGLARFVVGFVDDVPPEALKAMEAVRQASVGVYRLRSDPTARERQAMMQATSDRMETEGWHRVVAAQDDGSLVLVFVPAGADDPEDLQLCVVVCDGDDLMVVSAHGRTAPLRELAEMQTGAWRRAVRRGREELM